MIENIEANRQAELHLHDGVQRRPRLVQADPPAGGHARPDGQPEGRDHRAAREGELHGGPRRDRVLHLDARRPQGPGRHRAAHGRLRLPHAPPGGRRPGRDHPLGGLRDRGVPRAGARQGDRRAQRDARRPPDGQGRQEEGLQQGPDRAGRGDHARAARELVEAFAGDEGVTDPGALRAQVRGHHRRLPGVLRPLAGLRPAGPDRRRGRHHRRAVDRRARHAADHADVPHRRRRRRGHHARPAAHRGAVRGPQAEGPGQDRHGRRRRSRSRTPTAPARSSSPTRPARSTARRSRGAPASSSRRARRSRSASSSTRATCTRTSCCPTAATPRPSGGPASRSTSSSRSRRSTSPRAWTSTTSTSS